MLLVSIGVQVWYRRVHTRGLKVFFNVVAFVGVFVHELAHYAFNNLFGVKTSNIKVKYLSEDKERVAPHGSVGLPDFDRNSFLQTFVGSVAPLLVSTFLFLFCLDIIFNLETEAWVNVVAIVFCVSLIIGSEPSGQDMKLIGMTFKRDPRYSLFQIALIIASGTIVWLFIDLYFIPLPFEVLYYIEYFLFVVLVYFLLRIVITVFVSIFRTFVKPKYPSAKQLTRKRRFKKLAPREIKKRRCSYK